MELINLFYRLEDEIYFQLRLQFVVSALYHNCQNILGNY